MSLFVDGLAVGLGVGLGIALTVGPAWLAVLWLDHEMQRRRALWGRQR